MGRRQCHDQPLESFEVVRTLGAALKHDVRKLSRFCTFGRRCAPHSFVHQPYSRITRSCRFEVHLTRAFDAGCVESVSIAETSTAVTALASCR